MAEAPLDPAVPEIGWRCALEHKDEADRYGGCHQTTHHNPYKEHMPLLLDNAQQEKPQGPLGDRHTSDCEKLADGLEKHCVDNILWIFNFIHMLAKAACGRYSEKYCVA